ncbi:MAG: hypothetical protein KIT89_05200 [Microcella sp.]|uniref:hypothetical protein n=1 Tax=Microcella sp. TaxID=1913979 RepID=UPI0024C5314F|nr:hypothetical protein [Microcella sp.]UYN84577.1 MAG: hypothetical protein KIT89_05200 [Microcella sp.]
MDREYEPNLDDERSVELDDDVVDVPPPTVDPDERIEAEPEAPAIDDERPA